MTKQPIARSILLSSNTQLVVGFLIPTAILLYLSDESRLGPLWAMVAALVLPLALELYSLRIRRKPSYISLTAIGGILIIGAISLLGLSEEWLAVRRSAVYIAAAVGLIVALRFKRELVDRGLSSVIDLDLIYKAANKKSTRASVVRHIDKTVYMFTVLLLLAGVVSYVFTIFFITAPTGTSAFNAEYAELRVISLIVVTLPFFVGTIGLLVYLASRIEKLTGLSTEELLKKKT